MVTYEYLCSNEQCKNNFETQQSIKEKSLVHCDECGQDTLERVISVGIAFVKEGLHDKSSLHKLAEINTKKLGKYEKQEKEEHIKQKKLQGRQEVQNRMAEKMGTTPVNLSEVPEYKKNSKVSNEKINKMTNQQKEKFIMTGDA